MFFIYSDPLNLKTVRICKLSAQLNEMTESLRGDRNHMARLHRDQSRSGQTAREDIQDKPSQATTTEPSGTTSDAIMLPSRKAAIRRARDVVQRTPKMRQERIEQLSQALQIGELILDSQILADKLIGTQFNDLQSAA